jgi:FkbM family methyltransferase
MRVPAFGGRHSAAERTLAALICRPVSQIMGQRPLSKEYLMHAKVDTILAILQERSPTLVVDIGANPLDGGQPPYAPLLQQGLCHLTGFEPHPDALAKLNEQKGPHETYLPVAVGDGREHTLHVCQASGMSSLLEPDHKTLLMFPMLAEWGRVVDRQTVPTVRLDDVPIAGIDLLKIDVQGAELMVFRGGRARLAHAVAVQAEVSFTPLYKDQPTFGDVDAELRSLGLVPHTFTDINRRLLKPLMTNDPYRALKQVIEADIVYVRDFRRMGDMTPRQLTQLALISHYSYASWDLAARCINELETRSMVQAGSTDRYIAAL